jgi:26S proteasome regulatory subunit N11
VVVDPVQSVRGKIVIGALRCIPQKQQTMITQEEGRKTTLFIGFVEKPRIKGLVRGQNGLYYQMAKVYKMNENEEQMLKSPNRRTWRGGFCMARFVEQEVESKSEIKLKVLRGDASGRGIVDEEGMRDGEYETRQAGKVDRGRVYGGEGRSAWGKRGLSVCWITDRPGPIIGTFFEESLTASHPPYFFG